MAFMVLGLLMLSLDTREVSSVPGSDVRSAWFRKLLPLVRPFQSKTRSHQKYCAPTFEARFSHFGLFGSAGGRVGLGPTWQKAQDMPTRYGRTRSPR